MASMVPKVEGLYDVMVLVVVQCGDCSAQAATDMESLQKQWQFQATFTLECYA